MHHAALPMAGEVASHRAATAPVAPPFTHLVSGRLFAGPWNTLLTVGVFAGVIYVSVHVLSWAMVNATWSGSDFRQCAEGGACWAFIRARFGQFVYGFYPEVERWRPNVFFAVLALIISALVYHRTPSKGRIAAAAITVLPWLAAWLLYGGFGLTHVPTDRWGGLLLTVVVSATGISASLPIGIALALGRRSKDPIVRNVSAVFIELWRGVPLVTVLFLFLVMLPIFLPRGSHVNQLVLALIGISVFAGAYMAEVVRGGLQAIPKGQYEAAQAIGLKHWQVMGLVVLPQALRIVIPGIVNTSIALIKDSTLVMVVGLFDLLNIVTAGANDSAWLGAATEGLVFAGTVFWLICFAMSRLSIRFEKRLGSWAC